MEPSEIVRFAAFVTAIFVTVVVFDANLHPAAGAIFIIGLPITPTSVRAVRSSIASIVAVDVSSAILAAIAIIVAIAVHSPVPTHFKVFPAHAVAIAATHPPVATDLTVVVSASIAFGALIPLLRGVLVR